MADHGEIAPKNLLNQRIYLRYPRNPAIAYKVTGHNVAQFSGVYGACVNCYFRAGISIGVVVDSKRYLKK